MRHTTTTSGAARPGPSSSLAERVGFEPSNLCAHVGEPPDPVERAVCAAHVGSPEQKASHLAPVAAGVVNVFQFQWTTFQAFARLNMTTDISKLIGGFWPCGGFLRTQSKM